MKQRATKIVATIGPASSTFEVLQRMIEAGVDVVRLNFSHGKAEDHIARAQMVRDAAAACGREIAVMADLQGPKIRVERFKDDRKINLQVGQKFDLDTAFPFDQGDETQVGCSYEALPRDVAKGDTLLLNDGLIVMAVDDVVGTREIGRAHV